MNRKEYQKNWAKNKRLSTNSVDKVPVDKQGVDITYDHPLTAREIMTLHTKRTQDQVDRFPGVLLPFGTAYYGALYEMKVQYA